MSSLSGLHKQAHTCAHTSVYKGHMHMNTVLHTQVTYDRLTYLHPMHVNFHGSSCSSDGHAALFPLIVLFLFVPGPFLWRNEAFLVLYFRVFFYHKAKYKRGELQVQFSIFDHICSYFDTFFFLEDFYMERKYFFMLLLPIDEKNFQNRNFMKLWDFFLHLIHVKLVYHELVIKWDWHP